MRSPPVVHGLAPQLGERARPLGLDSGCRLLSQSLQRILSQVLNVAVYLTSQLAEVLLHRALAAGLENVRQFGPQTGSSVIANDVMERAAKLPLDGLFDQPDGLAPIGGKYLLFQLVGIEMHRAGDGFNLVGSALANGLGQPGVEVTHRLPAASSLAEILLASQPADGGRLPGCTLLDLGAPGPSIGLAQFHVSKEACYLVNPVLVAGRRRPDNLTRTLVGKLHGRSHPLQNAGPGSNLAPGFY